MAMMPAGVPVRDDLVLELARLTDDEELAEKLERAYSMGAKLIALEFSDRDSIIRALEDPRPGLEELRGVLMREREWRVREGLVANE